MPPAGNNYTLAQLLIAVKQEVCAAQSGRFFERLDHTHESVGLELHALRPIEDGDADRLLNVALFDGSLCHPRSYKSVDVPGQLGRASFGPDLSVRHIPMGDSNLADEAEAFDVVAGFDVDGFTHGECSPLVCLWCQ